MNEPLRMNEAYALDVLERLLRCPSPTGYTHLAMRLVEQESAKFGFTVQNTAKGGGVITVQGAEEGSATLLSAHIDTLGAMVRSIKSAGTLRFTRVGGFMMQSIENEYCLIHTRGGQTYSGTILTTKPSVHVYEDAREFKRDEGNYEIRLDEPVRSKEDVEALGISAGDAISFDARPVLLPNGFIKSRHLDDKASVAVLLSLLEHYARTKSKPRRTVKLLVSNYEEIGHGSSYIPDGVEEMIAVDMGAMGDDLNCTERDVSICAKDSTGPYDWHMTTRLIELAKEHGLSYAVDIYPSYGSDASAALRGGHNIRAALVGPGVHASHGMERTHVDALHHTFTLLLAYLS
ncbi:M42 family metallopeptidase [Paenibacillus thermotolerans]|uniref:M42 family metallopeptidase n=1 Tax=Paenibacillus thermotolerans TaxID=3027807 RepID=UPI002367616B|nr:MULTISPECIES: M42 family metallopeptidase [unclassified Paenibacillus]